MKRSFPNGFHWALLVAALAASAGCNLNLLQNYKPNPLPEASPSPSPSPSASPSPSGGAPGVSDVAALIVLVYGYTCVGPDPNHGAGIITADCTAAQLTATPKKADGSDAVNHGNAITWTVSPAPDGNFPGQVAPQANNPLFNREVNALNAGVRVKGAVTVTALLKAPDGKEFTASKVVAVQ